MARAGNTNAAKGVDDPSLPPWYSWPSDMSRAERAEKFITTYCRAPKGYGYGQPLVLAPFQREWLHIVLADGVKSAAMALPRGNGKSTFLAAVALWALYDDDDTGAPQVPVVAMTLVQIDRTVYGVCVAMVNAEPELATRTLVYSGMGTKRLRVPYNGGELFPISNDAPGLQGLDPSLAVCDEIGFMPVDSWGALLLASGKRPHSLVVGIGTPGVDHDNALWHLRQRSLSGDVLPGFHFTEYAAPEGSDLFDEATWHTANPALDGGYMDIDALRTAVRISPEGEFRIFRLGQWIEGVESWLGTDGGKLWRSLTDDHEFFPGEATWLGIDVGLKHDSTAVCWAQFRDADGDHPRRLHCKVKIWFPRPDGRLDVADVMQFVRELADRYDVQGAAYDPRFFDLPAQQLADEGVPMWEMPQTLERMTPAVGGLFESIKRGELSHDDDAKFEAQVLAAVARFNERGFMLSKAKSSDRIDACVAMVLAHSRANARAPKPIALASAYA